METQGGNHNPWNPPPPPPPLPSSDFHWGGAGGSYPSDCPHFHGPPDHFQGPPDHFQGQPEHFQGPPAHFNGPPAHFNGPPEQFSHLARKRKFDRPDINARIAKLYVGPVPRNVSQQEVYHLFEEFGNVIEVVLLTDKKTGHQQEFCFVKYASVEEAERAIATLHNQFTFPGTTVPLKIKYAAEKRKRLGLEHIVHQDPSLSRSGPHSLGLVQHDSTFSGPVSAEIVHKVYVNGLNKDASKEEIAEIFSSYGDVSDIYIMRDELKRSRGCGFVGFSQRCMAMAAINGLNKTYFMRGCDLPLLVRFADPKKPKNGEFRPTPHLADAQQNNVSDALYLGNSSTCTGLSSKREQAGTSSCPVANQSRCPPQEMQQMQTAKPFSPSRLSQMSLQESQISQSPIASVDVELLSAMQSSKHGSRASTGIDFSEAFAECDWSEHICPDGDKYYFNCVTSESRWEKPEEFALCEEHIQRLKSQDRSRKEPRTSSTLVIPSEGNQVEAAQYQRRSCDFEKPQSTVSCSVEHSHELEPVAPCSAIRY